MPPARRWPLSRSDECPRAVVNRSPTQGEFSRLSASAVSYDLVWSIVVIDRDRAEIFPTTFEKDLTMKRNLIAVAVAVLGFAANAAIAEPTLQMSADEVIRLNAPEATSYQADTRADEQAPFTWNP
jgi:hypothetical protein